MPVSLINIGFGNVVVAARVVSVVHAESAPVRRMVEHASRQNLVVDATSGRKTRAVIVTDSSHVILSHVTVNTLAQKLAGLGPETEYDDE